MVSIFFPHRLLLHTWFSTMYKGIRVYLLYSKITIQAIAMSIMFNKLCVQYNCFYRARLIGTSEQSRTLKRKVVEQGGVQATRST